MKNRWVMSTIQSGKNVETHIKFSRFLCSSKTYFDSYHGIGVIFRDEKSIAVELKNNRTWIEL